MRPFVASLAQDGTVRDRVFVHVQCAQNSPEVSPSFFDCVLSSQHCAVH